MTYSASYLLEFSASQAVQKFLENSSILANKGLPYPDGGSDKKLMETEVGPRLNWQIQHALESQPLI